MADYSHLDLSSGCNGKKKSQPERIVLEGYELLNEIPDEVKSRSGGIALETEQGTLNVSYDDLATGTLLIGGTGCGKTTQFFNVLDKLVYQIGDEDIILIFDSKGDYKKRYYESGNPRHVLISVNKADRNEARSWNCFGELLDADGKISKDVDLIAGEVAKAVGRGMESETQPFFHLAAEDMFAKIQTSMVRDGARENDNSKLNNEGLYEVLSKSDNQAILKQTGKYSDYKYLSNYVGDKTSNQALGVYGYLMAMKNRVFQSKFRYRSPAGDFSIRQLVREKGGKIVFLEYDINYAETLSSIYSLFYDLAIKEALSITEKKGNTFFICDELNLIPYVSKMEELLNFGRAKGCKTLVGLQSVSQLKKNYDEAEAESMLAGFLTAVCFNSVDGATRKYVKERFGETFEVYNFGGCNISRNGYTVTDKTIIDLKVGEAVVDMKGVPPFKIRFADKK